MYHAGIFLHMLNTEMYTIGARNWNASSTGCVGNTVQLQVASVWPLFRHRRMQQCFVELLDVQRGVTLSPSRATVRPTATARLLQ